MKSKIFTDVENQFAQAGELTILETAHQALDGQGFVEVVGHGDSDQIHLGIGKNRVHAVIVEHADLLYGEALLR